ncbi:MAG: BofC C-terminal domain-containing protein [Bacillota bacterium]|nr:BofC C-terminal domain-containing protein [Bacillota bacterium]
MKKLFTVTGIIIVLCLVVSAGIMPVLQNVRAVDEKRNTQISTVTGRNVSSSGNSALQQAISYIVKDYNGKIAVFEEGQTEPFKVTNVPTNSLPKVDQNALKKGIKVKGQKELIKILQDYCS